MSSSKATTPVPFIAPVADFHYRQMIALPGPAVTAEQASEVDDDVAAVELLRRELTAENVSTLTEMEQRLRREYLEEARQDREKIRVSILEFEEARKNYFARVEKEVVQLSLAIAAKILHRESQVDPLLVMALVRVAMDQLKQGSIAVIRVRPEERQRWGDHFSAEIAKGTVDVVEDLGLAPKDCILETPLGSVNMSLDVQMKEVERGFLDVLAHRPVF